VLPWFVAGVTLVIALAAWRSAWKTMRRVDQLTQMFWTLRHQHDQLRAGAEPRPAPPQTDAFVPVSALKRK